MKKYLYLFTSLSLFLMTGVFAQDGQAAPEGRQQSMWQTLLVLLIAILFFYFILFRPEQKRRKTMEKKRSALKKGDKVTAMGIIGTVTKIGDQTIILRMVDGSKIEVLKAAITDVNPGTEEDAQKIEKEETKEAPQG